MTIVRRTSKKAYHLLDVEPAILNHDLKHPHNNTNSEKFSKHTTMNFFELQNYLKLHEPSTTTLPMAMTSPIPV